MWAILQQVSEAVWNASWRGSLLVGIVVVAQWIFGQRLAAKWRHALWFVVVARLALPVGPGSSWSVFNLFKVKGKRVSEVVASRGASASVVLPDASPTRPWTGRDLSQRDKFHQGIESPALVKPVVLTPQSEQQHHNVRKIWVCGWFLGAVCLMGRVMVNSLRMRRRVGRMAVLQDAEMVELLDSCRVEMGVTRRVELLEGAIGSPALFVTPFAVEARLVLPEGLADRFSREELRFIFLHELAHIKRRDIAVNWVVTLLQVLHWFNPVVWFAFAQMRADRELACDAMALECAGEPEKRAYGQTIIRALEEFSWRMTAPNLVGIAESKSQLRRRLKLISNFRAPSRWSRAAAGLMMALGVVGLTDAQSKMAPAASALETKAPEAVTIDGMVQEARLRIEMGRFSQAEAILNEALKKFPENRAAFYYLSLIKDSRRDTNGTNFGWAARTTLEKIQPARETGQLFTRTFRLDPNTFRNGLKGVVFSANPWEGLVAGSSEFFSFGGAKETSQGDGTSVTVVTNASTIHGEVRAFLAAAGVDFPTNLVSPQFANSGQPASPQKAMFFSDRAGILYVRATLRELDMIERALRALNVMPPQVSIEAKFVELDGADKKALGFDWLFGNAPFATGQIWGAVTNSQGTNSTNGVRFGAPTLATFSGILTRPQFRVAQQALEKRQGVDLITAPPVTTISGRQARISVEETKTILYLTPPPATRSTAPDANPTPAAETRPALRRN